MVFYLVSCSSSGACGWRCLPFRKLPLGVAAFSDAVCLTYCCAGGVGWAATLPFCYQCFSCAVWLAGVHWVLHPVSGGSHRSCDYSWADSVVVLFDSTSSRTLFVFLLSPPTVLDFCGDCAVPCLLSLALGWVRFWPAVSTAPVCCNVCSLGCPSWLVLLFMSLLSFTCSYGGMV